MNQVSARSLSLLISSILLLALFGCQKSGPYVELNGKRLDEAYLKSKSPEQYQDIRSQYDKQVLSALKNLAMREMFELEAAEKGLKPKDYSQKLRDSVPAPTEAEIVAAYEDLKKSGQIRQESLAEVHDRVAQFLLQERQQAVFAQESARLRKKYGFAAELAQKVVKVNIDSAGEPSMGAANAPITVVEFTDFRCGYCRKVRGTVDELHKKYGDKIRWVIKDSPFQPGSMIMHKAANCVAQQNPALYWKYFDLMFVDSRAPGITTDAGLEERAVRLGADAGKMRTCMKDPAMDAEIQKDLEEGGTAGVKGTPAFFVNGRFLEGAQPIEEFVAIIDDELQKGKK